MAQKWILLCGLLVICRLGFGQDKHDYIETYKHLAVSEMIRTGIPASIKMAQAILESDCGKSELACKANNHFGIKCGNDWKGKTFKKEDDDYEDGNLVKSCFREYKTVFDSYMAHSDFLTDPGKSKRYGFLFELESDDYKGWAKGLSKAGYATDPQYANRLIDIIEKYDLADLDHGRNKDMVSKTKNNQPETIFSYLYQNDVKYATAEAGDSPFTFAQRHDVTAKQILRYNDDIFNEDQEFEAGRIIYLQPKRNQFNGKQKVHLLKQGETLVGISQRYGIKLEALLKRNGLRPGDIPAIGQKIALKGKTERAIKTIDPYELPVEKQEEEIPETIVVNTTISKPVPPEPKKEIRIETASATVQIKTAPNPAHTVAKGETLYRIASQYGLTVDELKKMNNLSADTISIGQKLILK